jgi:hypothetical protein
MEDADNAFDLEDIVVLMLVQVALGLPLSFIGSFCGFK